jgi:protein involved in polysaccharide export with SLBB domain
MFERDEVAATIVEYRPVFVTGDVTRPGEQAFRPRMTVRQAMASAGGFSALGRANATSFDAANFRSEYITVWLSLAREHARVWRIKTELGENIDLDQKANRVPQGKCFGPRKAKRLSSAINRAGRQADSRLVGAAAERGGRGSGR